MADTKISALTAATTPLAGTEVLPIVQSGVTKQVSVADLTAGRAVSALSLSLTNALTAANGGTGQSSYTTGDLLYASGATALSKLADVATGNALISGGVGVAPSWGKIGLTTHVSGTLGVTNGGTGLSSATTGDLLYASGTNTWASLADVATGNALISGGVGVAPSWGKVGLTTHVSGTLGTGNGGTGLTSFTANGILYASSGSVLATSSNLTYDGSTVNITNANLKISDGNRLIMGASDPQIYGDGGVIKFRTSSTDRIGINTAAMYPLSSGGMDLGTSSLPWGNLYLSGLAGIGTSPVNGYRVTTSAGTSDNTLYRHHRYNAGGGTAISTACTQTTTAITTAKTIAGLEDASLVLVRGSDGGGNDFMDLLITQNSGTPTVITSKTLSGSPAARTYTISSFNLQLAMASGTYTTNCLWWQLSAR